MFLLHAHMHYVCYSGNRSAASGRIWSLKVKPMARLLVSYPGHGQREVTMPAIAQAGARRA